MHWLLLIGALVMWLPMVLLLAGGVWAVWRTEEAGDNVDSDATRASAVTPFLVTQPRPVPAETVEDQTVIRLEDYLRAERRQVEEFVSRPSVASLYQDCERQLKLT